MDQVKISDAPRGERSGAAEQEGLAPNAQPLPPRTIRAHLVPGLRKELHRYQAGPVRDRHGRYTVLGDVLLRDALHDRATDIHLDPHADGVSVRFRIDGRLHDAATLSRDHGIHLIRHFKAISNLDPVNTMRLADARITYGLDGGDIDLRLACAPTVAGEKLSVRILDRSKVEQRLDALGLCPQDQDQIRQWLAGASGMFLVVGPTGSGKTTTAYALLHELKGQDRSVVTIEDPVEYQVRGINQIPINLHREMGFGELLKGVLRLDPDYVFVGEMRDNATALAAADASASGRVLMTTLHGPDAVGAFTALRNRGLTDEAIASAVRMVVAQRLVRRLCPHCRRQQPADALDLKWIEVLGVVETVNQVWVAPGCEVCRGTGYLGRIGVFEVWPMTEAAQLLLLDHGAPELLRQQSRQAGFRTLAYDGWAKASAGVTSLSELRADVGVRCPR